MNQVRSFVGKGGNALLLETGALLPGMFPELVTSYQPCKGEIATMAIPESPVFDQIEPLDPAWFHRRITRGLPLT